MLRSKFEVDETFYRASANRMIDRIVKLSDHFVKVKAQRSLSDLELRTYWTLTEIIETETKMLLTAIQNQNASLKN